MAGRPVPKWLGKVTVRQGYSPSLPSTHTARHTGAALLVLGSEGDQTPKEIALGHVSAIVYGYDTLERYGPQQLRAWQVALGPLAVDPPNVGVVK